MKLDELTQAEWGDAADYVCERDKKYGTSELKVPAVVKPHMDDNAANPAPPTVREHMESHDIIPGISQMPQGTPRPGRSHTMLGCRRPQSNKRIASLPTVVEPNSAPIK